MDLVVPYMFYSNIVDNHLSFAYLLPIIHALILKRPHHLFTHLYFLLLLQVDSKFLRNMRFAKKHNKKGQKALRKAAQEK